MSHDYIEFAERRGLSPLTEFAWRRLKTPRVTARTALLHFLSFFNREGCRWPASPYPCVLQHLAELLSQAVILSHLCLKYGTPVASTIFPEGRWEDARGRDEVMACSWT